MEKIEVFECTKKEDLSVWLLSEGFEKYSVGKT